VAKSKIDSKPKVVLNPQVVRQPKAIAKPVLEYDETVDAAYIRLGRGSFAHHARLDDARGIDYATDGSVMGVEILSPARKGVNLDDLPRRDELATVLAAAGFRLNRE
jgi:uncharacterized protein YuzE